MNRARNRLTATTAKAQRLVDTGAVTEHDGVRVFTVDGDHDTYIVTASEVGSGWAFHCSCPSNDPQCSHAMAVRRTIRPVDVTPPADPFEGII